MIEEHPGGEARYRNPSLILWMSLEGPIAGEPRPDRDPYLQLEAEVVGHEIHVFEGDMWRGRGGKRGLFWVQLLAAPKTDRPKT